MQIKFDIFWNKDLGTFYKDNSIDTLGKEANVNIDLNKVLRIYVNFQIGEKSYTDNVEILDIENKLIRIPFKTDVIKQGLNKFELVAVMKDNSVLPSQTYTYRVDKSLENPNSVEADTNYPALVELIQEADRAINKVDIYWEEKKVEIDNDLKEKFSQIDIIVEEKLEGNIDSKIEVMIEQSQAFDELNNSLSKVDEWNGYFEETSGKIEEKYAERLNQVDSQLAHIANKGTTVEVLERVTKEEIDRQIQDGTIANLIVEDRSITDNKLAEGVVYDLIRTENIFNKDTVVLNAFIGVNGNVATYNGYSYNEEYIQVVSSKITSSRNFIIAQYDENKKFIKQGVAQNTFTLDENAKYIRLCVSMDSLDTFMCVWGVSLPSNYIPYFDKNLRSDLYVDSNKLINVDNLFNDIKINKDNILDEAKPTYFECDIDATFAFINFDITNFVDKEINVDVKYKIKLKEISNGKTSSSINIRLMNNDSNGFTNIGGYNVSILDITQAINSIEEVSYSHTISKASRYLKLITWNKDNAKYDIFDMEVYVNGVKISYFECGVYSNRGTIIDAISEKFTLATTEYIGKRIENISKASNKYNGKKFVFMGDSITYNGSYQNNLKLALNLADIKNIAYNGWTTKNLVDNMSNIPSDTDVISVWIGVNDFNTSRIMGDNSSRDNTTFYGSLHLLCEYLANNFIGKPVTFFTPLHCNLGNFTNPNSLNNQNLKLEDYRKVIHEVCSYYGIRVCDLHIKSGIAPHIPSHKTLYTSDGLHLNENGYNRVTNVMYDYWNNY